MPSFNIGKGIDKYIGTLETLTQSTTAAIGRAIYVGADVVADNVRAAIQTIPVEVRYYDGTGEKLKGLTSVQKAGLLEGLGIATKRINYDYVNVMIGFDGYNRTRTDAYPKGQPNALIAHSLESGTSFRQKNPVISKAVRSSRAKAEQVMADELKKQFERSI